MTDFIIRFLFGNLIISIIFTIFFAVKRILKKHLTSRIQYNLWFPLLGLLAVPFIPFRLIGFSQLMLWLEELKNISSSNTEKNIKITINPNISATNQINDFALSVCKRTPSPISLILCVIWFIGILAMIILVFKSLKRLDILKKSALPLQSKDVRRLYNSCLNEMEITKNIPIYSTAFLKSPVIVGLFCPCIYLPIHLISDYCAADIRYMLLHELQHYRHKDILADYLMSLFNVLYWFNPFVWYALKEMRNDKEVACDASVLKMLEQDSYEDYGNTLINFAEKISLTPFPFVSGLSGSMKQMKKRILSIASYEKPTFHKQISGIIAFVLITVVLLGFAPILSTHATDRSRYQWDISSKNISYPNLSAYFGEYEGSFVLYDSGNDVWNIHNMDHATLRVAPNSTYKIYDALFGLEEGIITPEHSEMNWNGNDYPFEEWNKNQTLETAMNNSVNWFFQTLDQQLGTHTLNSYVHRIGYGNEQIEGELSSYWLESSLKISIIEQIELLTKLYNNRFLFADANINAVKNAICLSNSNNGNLYGKTGTGRINGKNISGWFVGYIENSENVYFFATHIQADQDADGIKASEISLSILSDMGIWKE